MRLTNEHIGKRVYFRREGNEDGILIALIGKYDTPVIKDASGHITDGHSNEEKWVLHENRGTFENIFKKFGCNEPYVRELVTKIFKELGKDLPK